MPKLDRLKEELAIQKQLFFAAIAVVLGLSGWLVNNTDKVWYILFGGMLVVCSSGLFGLSRFRRMNQLLEEIENV